MNKRSGSSGRRERRGGLRAPALPPLGDPSMDHHPFLAAGTPPMERRERSVESSRRLLRATGRCLPAQASTPSPSEALTRPGRHARAELEAGSPYPPWKWMPGRKGLGFRAGNHAGC